MTTVARLLDSKGHDVWSIAPDASVYQAIELMAAKNIGALLVLEDDKAASRSQTAASRSQAAPGRSQAAPGRSQPVAGIVSERDYARKVILQGKSSRKTPVRDIMTTRVVYVRPERTIDECMALMTEHDIRHLPVLDSDDRPIGMISIGDAVRSMLSEKEVLIQQLESYITGR
jgi:CBS domain-containing protein